MKRLCLEDLGNDVFDVEAGSDITDTIAEAIALSSMRDGRCIKFCFNDVTIRVRSDSNPELIHRDWERALHGYTDKNIGPNPNPTLTNEEKASDARIEAENERKHQKKQAEYVKNIEAKKKALEAKLVNAPDIEILDVKRWHWFNFKEDNKGDYGGAVVLYAQTWARLMQVEIASGRKLEDVAKATSQEADTDGITGFMYGCAVSMLSQCWKHGERLRRWHNIKTQIGNEGEKANKSGGVLNPALLSFNK